MPDAPRRLRAARAAAAVLLVAVAGCNGVPRSGDVTAVRPVEAVQDRADVDRGPRNSPVFLRFPPPPPQATAEQVIRGFLDAHADLEPDLRVARQYLAPGTPWDPRAGVTVFSGEKTVSQPTGTREEQVATVTVNRTALVTKDGEYVPRRDAAPTTFRLTVRLVGGEYRLVTPPPGLLLSESGLERAFRRTVLYFPDVQRRRLVPDLVFVPRGTTSDVTAAAARLVAGPTAWVARATRTALPAGTTLSGTVAVLRGVATVNLSRHASETAPATRAALLAQVTWTLTEPGLGVDAVRVLVDGRELLAAGRAREAQRRSDWAGFDPDRAGEGARLYFLRDGRVRSLEGADTTAVRDDPDRLDSIAISRSGALLAAVRRNADGRQSLVAGALSGQLATRLVADRIVSPSWEADGDRVWLVRGVGRAQVLVAVSVDDDAPALVTVSGAGDPGAVVDGVAVSPEGARALLVLRRGSAREVVVGRIERGATGFLVAGLRPLRPAARQVRTVAWETATRVVVADGTGLIRVDVDGFAATEIPSDGLPTGAVDRLTGGPAVDLVAEVAGRLYRRAAGWRPIGVGVSPVYAG